MREKNKSLAVLSEKRFQTETLDLNDKEIKKSAFKRIKTKPRKNNDERLQDLSACFCVAAARVWMHSAAPTVFSFPWAL